jgi:hypothetical protein
MKPNDPEALQVAFLVFDVLDSLGRPYHLGGSYASSIHGIPRQTHDIPIVCDLQSGDAERLATEFAEDFYCDRDRIAQAISKHSSFNLVHLKTGVKIDLFPKGKDRYDSEELDRSQMLELGEPSRPVPVKTAEDTILRKLEWYRQGGGEVSERQWGDVLGILRIQDDRLDLDYLRSRSETLGVGDLLEEAFEEVAG